MNLTDRDHYDPYSRQPRTLAEWAHWTRAAEVSRNAARVPYPCRMDPPPVPGRDRLIDYGTVTWGIISENELVQRVIAQYAIQHSVSRSEAGATSIADAANALAPMRCVSSLAPPLSSRDRVPAPPDGGADRDTVAGGPPVPSPPAPQADPCTHGLILLADYHRRGEKPTVTELVEKLGVSRQALYENKSFVSFRDMGNKLFGLFEKEAKKGDWRGSLGTKDKDGNLEAVAADEESVEDKAVD